MSRPSHNTLQTPSHASGTRTVFQWFVPRRCADQSIHEKRVISDAKSIESLPLVVNLSITSVRLQRQFFRRSRRRSFWCPALRFLSGQSAGQDIGLTWSQLRPLGRGTSVLSHRFGLDCTLYMFGQGKYCYMMLHVNLLQKAFCFSPWRDRGRVQFWNDGPFVCVEVLDHVASVYQIPWGLVQCCAESSSFLPSTLFASGGVLRQSKHLIGLMLLLE